jgi:hypothetical protein
MCLKDSTLTHDRRNADRNQTKSRAKLFSLRNETETVHEGKQAHSRKKSKKFSLFPLRHIFSTTGVILKLFLSNLFDG